MWNREISTVITPEDVGNVVPGLPGKVLEKDVGKLVYREWDDSIFNKKRAILTVENDEQLQERLEKLKDQKIVPPEKLKPALQATDELIKKHHEIIATLEKLKKALVYHCAKEYNNASNS